MARLLGCWLTVLLGALVASGCGGPRRCATDADCPDRAWCEPKIGLCFSEVPDGDSDGGDGPDFAVQTSPEAIAVVQGESAVLDVTLEVVAGFDAPVTVTLEDAPAGVTAGPVRLGPAKLTGSMLVVAATDAPPGTGPARIEAVGGGRTKRIALEVTVQPSPILSVDFSSPAADVHTNGSVSFQVVVSGANPESVELTRDGDLLVRLEPPYQYTWDTTSEPEGTYDIGVRAVKSGKTWAGPVRKVTVDRTPPTLVNRTPAPGAPEVPVRSAISATFSEPVRDVTETMVVVTNGGGAVAKSVALSADRLTLTITPDAQPTPPATFNVTLSGVKDLAGNDLASTQAWTWTYPSWLSVGPPLSRVGGNTKAEAPVIRIDPSGRPVVAWIESDGASKNV